MLLINKLIVNYIIKMESTKVKKKIDIKNLKCYYLDDIVKAKDFDFDNILIDEKSYKNILVYNISYMNSVLRHSSTIAL